MTAEPNPLHRRFSARILATLLVLAAAWLLPGCAGLYLDPGPQAARLEVPVKGQVTPEQRAMAAAPFGGLEWANFPPRYNRYSEPLWDAQAFIISPEGGYYQLPPAPGTAIQEQEGYAVDTTAQFLAPPGRHRLRVVFTCSVRRTYMDHLAGEVHEYLYLLARERILDVDLPPSGSATVDGFTGR